MTNNCHANKLQWNPSSESVRRRRRTPKMSNQFMKTEICLRRAGRAWLRHKTESFGGRKWSDSMREREQKEEKELQKHGMLESRSIGNGPAFGSFIVQTDAFVLVHVSCAFRSPCLVGSGRIRYDYLRRSIQNFSSGWGKRLVQALTLKPVL